MSSTTRSMHNLPRQPHHPWMLISLIAATGLFAVGWLGGSAQWLPLRLATSGLITIVAAVQSVTMWRTRDQLASPRAELACAAVVMLASFACARTLATFGLESYPLIYLMLAGCISQLSRRSRIVLVLGCVGLEIVGQVTGMAVGQDGVLTIPLTQPVSWGLVGFRTTGLLLFGALAGVVHGAEIMERRQRHKREVEEERANMVKEAREFRLIHSGRVWETAAASRERSEELIMTDAVEAVHHTTYVSLQLLKRSLGCHTCVLLWFNESNTHLHIKELVSDSDAIIEAGIEPARGVIGGITRRREPVNLSDLKSNYRGIPYYRESSKIKHFLGLPVLEHGHLRGVLCVDRSEDRAFDAYDVDMLEETAAYILRAVQNERLFTSIERSKFELGRFFEASRRLNSVLTPEDVWREALSSIAEISPFDLAAFTIHDEDQDLHTIANVVASPEWEKTIASWQGQSFNANSGWVSMAIKNRHYLPYGGHVRDSAPVVFTRAQKIHGLQSLVVLPLIAQDRVLGSIVLGHHEQNRYTTERREMLEVVCTQIAISLQNANLYAQMEEMATRDALTGLPNRRTFNSRITEACARHKRSDKAFAVVLSDIDHFKHVNDTYGHPVGDEVLRQVAQAFRDCLRETDLPARYGGEEFIVLLEETDLEGAMVIANRLREAVAALTFQSDKGPFSCTISMGVGMWPEDEPDVTGLIDLADQSLYYSKEHGRNQVTAYQDLPKKKLKIAS